MMWLLAVRFFNRNSRVNTIDIKKGEPVHHPLHGIGRVQSIRERSFGGPIKARYAEIAFQRDGLTLTLLEQDLDTTVRRLITRQEAKNLLDQIKSLKGETSKQWKARAEANQKAIDAGDPAGYAKVFKGLRKLEEEGDLRPRDRAHMNKSLDLLSEELAHSLGKTHEQARKLVNTAGAG